MNEYMVDGESVDEETFAAAFVERGGPANFEAALALISRRRRTNPLPPCGHVQHRDRGGVTLGFRTEVSQWEPCPLPPCGHVRHVPARTGGGLDGLPPDLSGWRPCSEPPAPDRLDEAAVEP